MCRNTSSRKEDVSARQWQALWRTWWRSRRTWSRPRCKKRLMLVWRWWAKSGCIVLIALMMLNCLLLVLIVYIVFNWFYFILLFFFILFTLIKLKIMLLMKTTTKLFQKNFGKKWQWKEWDRCMPWKVAKQFKLNQLRPTLNTLSNVCTIIIIALVLLGDNKKLLLIGKILFYFKKFKFFSFFF